MVDSEHTVRLATRVLPGTDLEVARLGLGGAKLGGVFNDLNGRAAIELVQAAIDAGITFLDTSNLYAQGESEEIIGRARTFIKGNPVPTKTFRLDEVTRDVLSLLRHEAASRRVDVQCSLPAELPPATGDRVDISQVIVNLLINGMDAVKNQPASARHVILEARISEEEGIEITVRDTGPGIPEGRFEEIFTPLFTTKTGGLGVGLALSRMIVDAYGGRLWAENGETGGAIFRFTLPRGPAPVRH